LIVLLPWLLLAVVLITLFISGHRWFSRSGSGETHLITTSTIVQEIEELGRMELVKYNFKEILDYQHLSKAKVEGNVIMKSFDFDPDISAVMIASGEAAGCIDLRKVGPGDIFSKGDTLFVTLPRPELCYYKLDLENTRIHSFTRQGWWSRLFADENEEKAVYEMAYRNAERQIRAAALQSGILEKTRENAELILKPFLENISGKNVVLTYDIEPGLFEPY
jgi:hypothetical protein